MFVCFLFLSIVRIEFPSLFLSSLILFSVFSIPLLILSNELLNLSFIFSTSKVPFGFSLYFVLF